MISHQLPKHTLIAIHHIHHFKTVFLNSRAYLQSLISSNVEEDNKLLLELHFLMN